MSNRWGALALLFAVRTVMAFQFQTVAALSPFIETAYGVGLGDVGLLLGLYMAPGIVLAIPGGALAARLGEKRVVILSLWLMALGLAMMALLPGWGAAMAGRLIAGIGGILMNVIMTKMVVDWFEGREIATAMSIFIVSWPAGIALALLVLPPVAASAGLAAAFWVAALAAALAAVAFLTYRAAPGAGGAPVRRALSRRTLSAALSTGATWGFFNGALAVVFGFGVALLVSRGVEVGAAGQVTSLTMIALALVGPLGGMIADRTGRYLSLITGATLVMAALLAAIAAGQSSIWLFLAFGAVCGLAAGPVMSLAGQYLPPEERGAGMGVFFTVYYICIMATPAIAGYAADIAGRAEAAFVAGIVFCVLTLVSMAALPLLRPR